MLDTSHALEDMAHQIRDCRAHEGLTLQQLADRSGVAASTIHKVEARQMVPTVSVLLKIARGLGRRPDELIRDEALNHAAVVHHPSSEMTPNGGPAPQDGLSRRGLLDPIFGENPGQIAIWRLDLSPVRPLPDLEFESGQRALLLVEDGRLDLEAAGHDIQMETGDCIQIEGGNRIESAAPAESRATVVVIASPAGELCQVLGPPRGTRAHSH